MAVKRNVGSIRKRNALITVVAIALIIAVAAAVLYFGFPAAFNKIADFFNGNSGGGSGGNLARGEGDLLVHFIDVGQGDCILIQFPDGKDMLIDCGNKSSGYEFSDTEAYIKEKIGDNQLDYMMLTHGDEDHVEYLDDLLEEFQVDNIFMPNIKAAPIKINSSDSQATIEKKEAINSELAALDETKTALFTDDDTLSTQVYVNFFIAALTEPECEITINMDADDETNTVKIVEKTYSLIFYSPTQSFYAENDLSDAHDKNAVSPIGILEYNGFRIVLTGDSNGKNEPEFIRRLGSDGLDCDVLKVAHHGSDSSTSAEFLYAIGCEYAVISCNASGNNFNHPRQSTLDRLTARNMTIYRTDNNGTILLTVNDKLGFSAEFPLDIAANKIGLPSPA